MHKKTNTKDANNALKDQSRVQILHTPISSQSRTTQLSYFIDFFNGIKSATFKLLHLNISFSQMMTVGTTFANVLRIQVYFMERMDR